VVVVVELFQPFEDAGAPLESAVAKSPAAVARGVGEAVSRLEIADVDDATADKGGNRGLIAERSPTALFAIA